MQRLRAEALFLTSWRRLGPVETRNPPSYSHLGSDSSQSLSANGSPWRPRRDWKRGLRRLPSSAEALDSLKATSGDLGEHIPLDRFDPLVCNQGRESFLISPSPVIALPVYLRAED